MVERLVAGVVGVCFRIFVLSAGMILLPVEDGDNGRGWWPERADGKYERQNAQRFLVNNVEGNAIAGEPERFLKIANSCCLRAISTAHGQSMPAYGPIGHFS
jgi:hypothetical protein